MFYCPVATIVLRVRYGQVFNDIRSFAPRVVRKHRLVQALEPGLTVLFLPFVVLAQGGGGGVNPQSSILNVPEESSLVSRNPQWPHSFFIGLEESCFFPNQHGDSQRLTGNHRRLARRRQLGRRSFRALLNRGSNKEVRDEAAPPWLRKVPNSHGPSADCNWIFLHTKSPVSFKTKRNKKKKKQSES